MSPSIPKANLLEVSFHHQDGRIHKLVCSGLEEVYDSLRKSLFTYTPSPNQFNLLMLSLILISYRQQSEEEIIKLLLDRNILTLKDLTNYHTSGTEGASHETKD